MTKKTTKRALLMSALSILMCVSMLIGSTFAWFTDSVTSGSNIIKSGTLDIVLEYWDGENWIDAEGKVIPFVAADGRSEILWEPGCTYKMAPIRVRNEGSLNAKILILISGVTGDAKLLETIEFKNRINNIPQSVLNGSAGNQLSRFEGAELGFMYGMPEGNIVFDWSLAGKGTVTPGTGHTDTSPEFTISGHMAEEAGNEYQGLAIEGISITVIATQQTYEFDSFGKDYDINATYPVVGSAIVGENANATTIKAGNVSVTVPAGVPVGAYKVVVSNKNSTTNEEDQTTFTADIDLLKDGVKVERNGNTVYAVEIELEADKSIVKVLHKGNEITDYEYDAATGIIRFETDSFSPFAVIYEESKTVKVNTSEELINTLATAETGAVIDAAGVTIDINAVGTGIPNGKMALDIPGGVTIQNLTVLGSYRGGNTLHFRAPADEEIVFENCTFSLSGRSMGFDFMTAEDGANSVVYNNCTFNGAIILECLDSTNAVATYNNCTFAKHPGGGNSYVMASGGTHLFNGCTFDYTGLTQSNMGIANTCTINVMSESDGSNTTVVVLDGCTRINCGTRKYGADSTLTIK